MRFISNMMPLNDVPSLNNRFSIADIRYWPIVIAHGAGLSDLAPTCPTRRSEPGNSQNAKALEIAG